MAPHSGKGRISISFALADDEVYKPSPIDAAIVCGGVFVASWGEQSLVLGGPETCSFGARTLKTPFLTGPREKIQHAPLLWERTQNETLQNSFGGNLRSKRGCQVAGPSGHNKLQSIIGSDSCTIWL